jgi:hypothetical protein
MQDMDDRMQAQLLLIFGRMSVLRAAVAELIARSQDSAAIRLNIHQTMAGVAAFLEAKDTLDDSVIAAGLMQELDDLLATE